MTYSSAASDHTNSQVISGALWDVRQALGAGTTDYLAFKAMQISPQAYNFSDYGYNMVVADYELYGGSHESTIRTYFGNHGISIPTYTPAPDAPTNLTVSGTTGQNPQISWSASSGADGYKVYRCANVSYNCYSYSYIGSTSSTSYTDLNKVIGTSCGSGPDEITYYKVKAYNTAGESGFSNNDMTCTDANKGIAEAEAIPEKFSLENNENNYPNPFNPSTEIRFDLPEAVHVRLTIYDTLGRTVSRLVDAPMSAGQKQITWNASHLPAGVYI